MGKLTRHARMQPCTVRLPCCNGETDTTVFCHAPSVNRGGMRDENWWGAFACSSCHDLLDGRTPTDIPLIVIEQAWLRGIHETLRIQFRDGLIHTND